jgi:polyphosphate kinase
MSESQPAITYTPRDLSWLHFNYRVLQEAMNEEVPLYERIKFLAIYSSNLDEFFRVRVAALRSFKELRGKDTAEWVDAKPKKTLKAIRRLVQQQQQEFGRTFRESILPALEREDIVLAQPEQLSESQLTFAEQIFQEQVAPLLKVQHILARAPLPFLDNKALYFIYGSAQEEAFHLVNIPSDQLDRFFVLPNRGAATHYIVYLDDIIRIGLRKQLDQQEAYSIKLSRDAELYLGDEYSGDLLAKIRASLAAREIGLPTRMLYDQRMPKPLLKLLRKRLGLSKYDLIPGSRYHNFNDFFAFPNPSERQELHDPPLPPLLHPILEGPTRLLQTIRKQDILLHFPYQRYDYVPQLVMEAAVDPAVNAIRITLYRVAGKSAIMDGLLAALEAGKHVQVFVEAKARFDEASNLYWGDRLAAAGAEVRYSFPGIKVHTKLLLIEAQDGDVAYLGTGNFNEKTAKLYADHALLTAAPTLVADTRRVFDLLAGKLLLPKTRQLLVAPYQLHDQILAKIDREIAHALAGRPAAMLIKLNSLEEQSVIDKLYEASQAGVEIRLIVRGICCLQAGVPGQSDNIEAISIVDRFLEHARVYHFHNAGQDEIYLASADWMTRNLHRRVEVAIPILDVNLRAELLHICKLQWADNCKARSLQQGQFNQLHKQEPGMEQVRAQVRTYEWLSTLKSARR